MWIRKENFMPVIIKMSGLTVNRWFIIVVFSVGAFCAFLILNICHRNSTPRRNSTHYVHHNASQIVTCRQTFSNDAGDSKTGAKERWIPTGQHAISHKDTAIFFEKIRSAKESCRAETIPAAGYKDLIVLVSDGKAQFAVARLDFEAYCRISNCVLNDDNSILIDLASDNNVQFVYSSELWLFLKSFITKKTE